MTDTAYLNALKEHLQRGLLSAHETNQKPLSAEDAASIVRDVVQSMESIISISDLKFYKELEELAQYIRQAKQDIAQIVPREIITNYIPKATDELDAVVGATEEATNKIMDVCDEVTAIAETCSDEARQKLVACTTKVYEACNFQDITGQRITKVVEVLKHIDSRIDAIVKAMGDDIHHGAPASDQQAHATESEKKFLNGPQLPKNAINQDEIDRLLSGH